MVLQTSFPRAPLRTAENEARATLRLLETTDLHSHLLPYDYYGDHGGREDGLARTATLIRAARAEADNVLLFDNGDALQGSPVADITADPQSGWTGVHPAILAMNCLAYDAATLGNHEFNFGLPWLTRMLSAARHPVTCANLKLTCGGFLPPYLLLDRMIRSHDGKKHPIRIGIIGLVPPQVTSWDHLHLGDRLISEDMVKASRELVPRIREEGADLVVALAHTGIDTGPAHPFMENAALQIAAVPGVDALLAGHSHQIFPDSTVPGTDGGAVDSAIGTLSGTPAVMAGFGGSHLGILDLALRRHNGHWTITGHRSEARPVTSLKTGIAAVPDAEISRALTKAHAATLRLTRRPIGHSLAPLHSYLAMVGDSAALRLVNAAQHEAMAELLRGTAHENLPILSATAPFKAGGRGGPGHYTDIPAVPLKLRHAADLYIFPNTLCGLRITGALLHDWLERAASCFNRIGPGARGVPLLNPEMPSHDFDVISGLTYRIDLSQPARHAPGGALASPGATRIRDLRHAGKPVRASDVFILATNSYRAYGGGGYPDLPDTERIHTGKTQVREVLVRHIRSRSQVAPPAGVTWSFAPQPGASAILETGPGVRRHAAELAALGATDLGGGSGGFVRLHLPFDGPLASPGNDN